MQNTNESEIRKSLISSQIRSTLANLNELTKQYAAVRQPVQSLEEFLVDDVIEKLKQKQGIEISTNEQVPELNSVFSGIQTSLAENSLDKETERSIEQELMKADADDDSRLNAINNRWSFADKIFEGLAKQLSVNPKLNFSRVKYLADKACERMEKTLKENAGAAVYDLIQRHNSPRFLLKFPPYAGRKPGQRFYLSIAEAPTSQAAKKILQSAYQATELLRDYNLRFKQEAQAAGAADSEIVPDTEWQNEHASQYAPNATRGGIRRREQMADPVYIAAIEHDTDIMALNSDAALKLLLEEAERNPGSILALSKEKPVKLA